MIHQAFTQWTIDRRHRAASYGHAQAGRARIAFTRIAFAGALLLALIGALLGPEAATAQEDALFAVGDRVSVIADEGVNLRDGEGEAAGVVETLPLGTEATILALPATETDDGFDWYQIETDDDLTGWVAGEFIELVEAADDGAIAIGSTVAATDGLNLRDEAGLDAEIIETLQVDTEMVIDSEPEEIDDLLWYRVSIGNREIFGWVAGDFLEVIADPPVIEIGNMVAVNTDLLTVRDGAGLDAEAVDTVAYGFAATVIDGPVEADGFTWFQIESDELTGWVAGAWLTVP